MKHFSFIFCFFFCTLSSFSQESSDQIEAYRTERLNRLNAHESYADLEMQIAQTGTFPDALVKIDELETNQRRFSFQGYKPIPAAKEVVFENRIQQQFPEITSIQIENNRVSFTVMNSCAESSILEILRVFGYTGFTQIDSL